MSDPARLAAAQMAYDNEKKNGTPSWLLWVFLGWWGGDRFYLGKIGPAVAMLLMTLVGFSTSLFVVGDFLLGAVFIWWIVNACLLNREIRAFNTRKQVEVFNRFGLTAPVAPPGSYISPVPQQLPAPQSPYQLPPALPQQYPSQPQQVQPPRYQAPQLPPQQPPQPPTVQ